jgi:hypothetical protein
MSKRRFQGFSDLDEDLYSERADHLNPDGCKADERQYLQAGAYSAITPAPEAVYESKCKKCRGGGSFISYTGRIVGKCFACNGTGIIKTRTHPEVLEQRKQQRKQAKKDEADAIKTKAALWLKDNPPIQAWFVSAINRDREFGRSLWDALFKYGQLTEGQLGAIQREIDEDIARQASQPKRLTNDSLSTLVQAFTAAKEKLKKPRLRIRGYLFALAPDHGMNAGYIYVHEEDTYLGKIDPDGAFQPSRECTDEITREIQALDGNLFDEAIAYGKVNRGTEDEPYYSCCMCNRQLTHENSIARGIGPICADTWSMEDWYKVTGEAE